MNFYSKKYMKYAKFDFILKKSIIYKTQYMMIYHLYEISTNSDFYKSLFGIKYIIKDHIV